MATPFVNHILNGLPEHDARLLELPRLRALKSLGNAQRPEAVADVLVDDDPRLIDLRREWTEIAAEQRTQDDGAREAHHLVGDVHRSSVRGNRLPFVRRLARRLRHHAGERRDTLPMECRLRDPALPQPELVFAGQQPIPDRHPQLLIERALVIIARVVLQHVTDIGGIGNEIASPRTDLEVDDVAEAARRAHEHTGGIASDRRQHAENRHSAWARWNHVWHDSAAPRSQCEPGTLFGRARLLGRGLSTEEELRHASSVAVRLVSRALSHNSCAVAELSDARHASNEGRQTEPHRAGAAYS